MEYLAVEWKHGFEDMPTEIYSELDAARMETRKVEMFRGGLIGYASATESNGRSQLGIEPLPSLSEIASQPEFQARLSNAQEFESKWKSARDKAA